jgi:hypothetical protein
LLHKIEALGDVAYPEKDFIMFDFERFPNGQQVFVVPQPGPQGFRVLYG